VSLVLVSRAQPSALGLLGLLPGIVSLPFPAYSEPQLIDILAAVSASPYIDILAALNELCCMQ
jgi:hypothetical protein